MAIRRALQSLPFCALLLALAPRAPAVAEPAAPRGAVRVAVRIQNFAFIPAVLTVAPGTTVTWTNRDQDPHVVVATGHAFRSGAIDTNGTYSFIFTRPGDYAYFCALHPQMTARIIVRAR